MRSLPEWLPPAPDEDTAIDAKRALFLQMKPFAKGYKPFNKHPKILNLLKPKHVMAELLIADYEDREPLLLPISGLNLTLAKDYDPFLQEYMQKVTIDPEFTQDETTSMINGIGGAVKKKLGSLLVWNFIATNVNIQSIASKDLMTRKEVKRAKRTMICETIEEYGSGLRDAYERVCTGTCEVR